MKNFFSKETNNCIDIHCHIIPGIDDGAENIDESLDMLRSAQKHGITDIVATPHVREANFDFGFASEQFSILKSYADEMNIGLYMGFEVNCEALVEFGFKSLDKLCFKNSDSLLLEFRNFSMPPNWQLIIKKIQAEGLQVIIAHPERYSFIQKDIDRAEGLVDLGCLLQCDSFVFDLNRFDKQRKTAYRLMDRRLVSWIASDAHAPGHYHGFKEVFSDFSSDLLRKSIAFE